MDLRSAPIRSPVAQTTVGDAKRVSGTNTGRAAWLAQACALETSDHRQHEPHDCDLAVVGEGAAEFLDDAARRRAAGDAADDPGDCDHDPGVQPQREAENNDQDTG